MNEHKQIINTFLIILLCLKELARIGKINCGCIKPLRAFFQNSMLKLEDLIGLTKLTAEDIKKIRGIPIEEGSSNNFLFKNTWISTKVSSAAVIVFPISSIYINLMMKECPHLINFTWLFLDLYEKNALETIDYLIKNYKAMFSKIIIRKCAERKKIWDKIKHLF